jgi:hypothetical protein
MKLAPAKNDNRLKAPDSAANTRSLFILVSLPVESETSLSKLN